MINRKKGRPSIKYLFHSLLGSLNSRYTHSMPTSLIHLGALALQPASKSIVAPTAKKILTCVNLLLYLTSHFSCLGAPTPMARTVAPDLLIASIIFSHSSSLSSKPKEGECASTPIDRTT